MSNSSPKSHTKKRVCLRCRKEFRSEGNRLCWQCHAANNDVGKMGEFAPPSDAKAILNVLAMARKRKSKSKIYKEARKWVGGTTRTQELDNLRHD